MPTLDAMLMAEEDELWHELCATMDSLALEQLRAGTYVELRSEENEISSQAGVAIGWIRKSGPDHYREHLPRLHAWVQELQGPSGQA